MVVLGFAVTSTQAQVNLGKIKDKVKDKGGKTVNTPNDNSGSSGNSSTETKIETSGKESGYDLYMKGNEMYEAEKYNEALAYYKKAEEAGYVDGEMRVKMNRCRDNMDPNKQKEEQDVLNKANGIMEQLDAMKYKIDPVQDQGMTNEFHRANVGKIVFAKTEIPKTETSGNNLTNTFNLGDNIFSRVYLAQSYTNEGNSIGYIAQWTDFRIRMTVDGQKFDILPTTSGYPLSKVAEDPTSRNTWTTFQIGISPNVEGYPSTETRDFFYRMYQLPNGTHKVKLEVVFDIPDDEVNKGTYGDGPDQGRKWTTKFGPEKVLAAGEFAINVTEAGKIAVGKKICPDMSWLKGTAKIVPDGMAMISKSKRENETILKVVEFGNDWTYHRNAYGVILSRTLKAQALLQDNKTKLCYVVYIEYSQENTSSGGSKYAPTMFSRNGSFETPGENGLFVRECTGL